MNYNNKQIPVAISLVISGMDPKIFIIDSNIKIELAIKKLWRQFFNYII